MTLYVDSSALTSCYVREDDSEAMIEAVGSADDLATARLTLVETGRAIALRLPAVEARRARARLEQDATHIDLIELDPDTCAAALDIAIETGCRTLDALHLAALWRLGGDDLRLLTRDRRQARAAIEIGLPLHPASTPG